MFFAPKEVGTRVKFTAPDDSGVELVGVITEIREHDCIIKTDNPFCLYAGEGAPMEEITDEFCVLLSECWQFSDKAGGGLVIELAEWPIKLPPFDPTNPWHREMDDLAGFAGALPGETPPAGNDPGDFQITPELIAGLAEKTILQSGVLDVILPFMEDLKTLLFSIPDGGKTTPAPDSYEVETLPHAEDFIAEFGELSFVGLWVYWSGSLAKMSDYLTENITERTAATSSLLNWENTLSRWVENSADYLPEWANHLLK